MRPINLIPPEERRSHGSTARTGPLAYVIVGALAVLLIGVVVLVLTSNQISDREDEVVGLEAQRAAAVARAEQLTPYTSFQELTQQRTQTIANLADSRFDWVRVIRQLSLILPPGVYLTNLTGSAGGGGEGGGAASGVSGPSLSLEGCAGGQDMVAVFVASLKGIDGVTRVGLENSTVGSGEGGGGEAGAGVCAAEGVADFSIIVAFDEAPPSPDGPEAASLEAAEAEGEGSEAESTEGESGEAEESSGSGNVEHEGGEEPTGSSASAATATGGAG